jgi:Zn-dependent M28 family amino/carboxypeptidase
VAGCQPRVTVDGARPYERVAFQLRAGPRVPGTAGHDTVQAWIERTLREQGARVEVQSFVDSTLGRPLELSNIIGHFGPSDGRRIGLLAHWDSRPWCDEDPDTTRRHEPLPGANDGASGVAVLLEVGEQMRGRPPRVGVDLVFLDGEDLGTAGDPAGYCRGARDYAARARAGAKPIAAGFVFDMVGDRDLSIHPEVTAARQASNLVSLVLDAARATGARHFHADPKWEIYDDHIPLLEAGIPAVDIIDFDYPAWHTTRDGIDQVSAESLAEVTRVALWIAYDSALAHPMP